MDTTMRGHGVRWAGRAGRGGGGGGIVRGVDIGESGGWLCEDRCEGSV